MVAPVAQAVLQLDVKESPSTLSVYGGYGGGDVSGGGGGGGSAVQPSQPLQLAHAHLTSQSCPLFAHQLLHGPVGGLGGTGSGAIGDGGDGGDAGGTGGGDTSHSPHPEQAREGKAHFSSQVLGFV